MLKLVTALALILIPVTAHARAVTYELWVELNDSTYIADYDLSAVECERTMDEIVSIIDETGATRIVPKDAPVYCVSM